MSGTLQVKVGLIVDPHFGERLLPLAQAFHLWVMESLDNSPVIRHFWDLPEDALSSDTGITMFAAESGESAEDLCLRFAHTIDENHPNWSELEVYGAELTAELRAAFVDLGADDFEKTRSGFICRR